jgi:hypothetical protein
MKILRPCGYGEVEVRIRKQPEDAYFEEHVKLNVACIADPNSCKIYVIREPVVTFSTEVTLKARFDLQIANTLPPIYMPMVIDW